MSEDVYVFSTRSLWLELNISTDLVHEKANQYFQGVVGLLDTDQAITLLLQITGEIQKNMLNELERKDVRYMLVKLMKVFDEVHHFYMRQRKARTKLVELNINEGQIVEQFEVNRNIARNIIDAVNIWLENCLIHQTIEPGYKASTDFDLDEGFMVEMYIYGLASQALSLLMLSKRNPAAGFNGLLIDIDKNTIAEVQKEHPIIFYNTLLAGNQNILDPAYKLAEANTTPFGTGFKETYNVEFLYFLGTISYFQKVLLNEGRIGLSVISKEKFVYEIAHATRPSIDPNSFLQHFTLTRETLETQRRPGEPIIWIMGANKYRYELCPYLMLDNGQVLLSYCALEQAKQLWCALYSNGGMCYSNTNNALTDAIKLTNTHLSRRLVHLIREKLRNHYKADFDEIDVSYERIFGSKPHNYGDYDIVFYSKEVGELFLIEAKFFSDSLTSSGLVTDFEKLFGNGRYYEHCRKRYDLALSEFDKMRAFVSADAPVDMHLLFISSKPLEVELQDLDKVTTFLSLNIFDKYLEGKLISPDDESVVRPTIRI